MCVREKNVWINLLWKLKICLKSKSYVLQIICSNVLLLFRSFFSANLWKIEKKKSIVADETSNK